MSEEIAFNPMENVMPSFITPIGRFRLGDHEGFDRVLSTSILRRAQQAKKADARKRAGWSSTEDVLNWPESELSELARRARSALAHMILLARDGVDFVGNVKVRAWARLHEAGAEWPISHHPRAHWTSLYFAQVRLSEPAPENSAGPLVFHDPRGSSVNMMPHPGAASLNGTMLLRPEPGLLLVFPAWLQYSIKNLEPKEQLIVVGFSATLTTPGEWESPIALA
jgi:hypothetical protein